MGPRAPWIVALTDVKLSAKTWTNCSCFNGPRLDLPPAWEGWRGSRREHRIAMFVGYWPSDIAIGVAFGVNGQNNPFKTPQKKFGKPWLSCPSVLHLQSNLLSPSSSQTRKLMVLYVAIRTPSKRQLLPNSMMGSTAKICWKTVTSLHSALHC